MSIVLVGSSSGSITLQEPAVAGTTTLNLPATSGTVVVTGTTPTLNGITFPASQSPSADANTLDDYEEGTWTPTDGSGAGLSFTVFDCYYTKIGRVVNISMAVLFPTTASSAPMRFSGLPFAVKSGDDNSMGLVLVNTNSGRIDTFAFGRGGTGIGVSTTSNTDVANSLYSAKKINLSGFYIVA
jgi:hypothetical protein